MDGYSFARIVAGVLFVVILAVLIVRLRRRKEE